MSNIVDFLATIGQDAKLRYASDEEMQHMLADMKLVQEVRDAVLAKDQKRLADLVGANNVCCLMIPAVMQNEFAPDGTDESEYVEKRA